MESEGPPLRRHVLRSATRVKSACPYCYREVYVAELRQHLNNCASYQAAQEENYPESSAMSPDQGSFGGLPVSPSSSRSSSSHNSVDIDYSPPSSDEERKVRSSNFMARLLRLNQSTDVEPNAPRRSHSPELQVYPLRPKTGKPTTTACPVCSCDYNRKPKTPLVLPACGHTLCAECAKRIFTETQSLKCPVCRSRNHQTVAGLPVNFALLEITESAGKKELCQKHGSEIVAFCKDHEVLLCGVCIFEHKAHKSFLLTSPEAAEMATAKKAQLESYEAALSKVRSEWHNTVAEMNGLSSSLDHLVEKHNTALRTTEARLVRQVENNKNACDKRLKALESECSIRSLRQSYSDSLQRVTQDLEKLKESKAHFDSLSVAEQLACAQSFQTDAYAEPPSLDCIKAVEEKLKRTVDYEEAVRSGSFLDG